jgi:hypothetical protein
MVVQLGIAKVTVLIADDLPMGFLGRWCHIVAEIMDAFHTLVVVGIGGVVFACVTEVVVGWGCFGDEAAQTKALASTPTGEGS